ncbi:MAG: hypothetical protein OEM52_13375 [bacterium]|nr:hypothetical protein [bacterium]
MNREIKPIVATELSRKMLELPGCIGVALLDSEGRILERTGRIAEWFIEKMNRIVATRGELIPTGAITVFQAPPEIAVLMVESEFIVIAECRCNASFGTMLKELAIRFPEFVTR